MSLLTRDLGQVAIITADSEFNGASVVEFVKATGVEGAGVDYTVVAIMGPQSSGKSTLLNHLFGTRFEEMDALRGRLQTTRGIWLARSPKVTVPTTLVMDLEGSDGRERGEDDTSFERQSALFALATADILLVNMWAKDVGREAGSGKPLLKTIFQVNLKLFHPAPGARRTVLLFVFRDRTKTPLERLKETWEADLGKMWAGIAKPQQYEACAISDFFDVQYAALSNYEDRAEDFLADATVLRRRFTDDADEGDGFLRKSEHKLPGQALALSMAKVWEVVKENKDLNLPAHRVMVANIRCAEIAAEQLASFTADAEWKALQEESGADLVPCFGVAASGLMEAALVAYEAEARYFDPGTSAARQEALAAELAALVRPAFESQLALARQVALESFRLAMAAPPEAAAAGSFVSRATRCAAAALEEFDALAKEIEVPETDWPTAPARVHLQRELSAHESELRAAHVLKSLEAAAAAAAAGVSAGAMPLLEAPPADLWARLGAVVEREVAKAAVALEGAVQGYGLDAGEVREVKGRVRAAARRRLLANAREAANTALPRLKDRFSEVFQKDDAGMPRTWSPAVDIPAVAAAARRAAAALLAQLCVVRLGGSSLPAGALKGASSTGKPAAGIVEAAVLGLAEDRAAAGDAAAADFDLLSASEWPGVAGDDVLLTPAQVRSVWRQFSSDSALSVQQAVATQEANRLAQNRLPPLWAVAAMIVLGFNEAVAVLRNPLWLLLLGVAFLFARTVYNEMEVEAEMHRGLLPGTLALSAKFVPTVKAVAWRTFESGKAMLSDGPGSPERPPRQAQMQPVRGGNMRVRYDVGQAVQEPVGPDGLRPRRREVEMQGLQGDSGGEGAAAGGEASRKED